MPSAPVEIVGASSPTTRLRSLLRDLAQVDSVVLLRGETGTGKSLAVRALHAWGPRADAPLDVIDCAGLPVERAEDRLAGASAAGGTLLLDEVGDLPEAVQGRLLRLIEGDAPCRIVATTQRDLAAAVSAGAFRRDLYYRLNVIPIRLLPLRDRTADVAPLIEHFAARVAARIGRPAPTFDAVVIEAACRYEWPGNVRELANLVERAVVNGSRSILAAARPSIPPPEPGALPSLPQHLQDEELRLLRRAWEQTGGNQSEMARILGLERTALRYKLRKYHLL
ncbi:MAG: sigma 54-interacting transcriptional regulator [Myxococcota bacterium]